MTNLLPLPSSSLPLISLFPVMYPDLSYLLHDFLGTQPDNWTAVFKTYGLVLVLAILASAVVLRSELIRRSAQGQFPPVKTKLLINQPYTTAEYVYNGIFGFIVGYKLVYALQHYALLQQDAEAVILSGAGSWTGGLLGVVLATGYYYYTDQQRKKTGISEQIADRYPQDRIGDITIIAAISGVVGAKVFDILEHLPDFFRDPLGVFFSGSGLAIYGGLIGGFAGVAFYLRAKKIPMRPFMDAVAPALMVGYAVGRLGCHFSGDGDWGLPAGPQPAWWFLPDWLWAYDYPHNVIQEGIKMEGCVSRYCHKLSEGVHPTSIYESSAALLVAGVLWLLRKRLQFIPGLLFALYLVLNGLERWSIEKIRVNERYDFAGGLTQAEIIALSLILVGLVWGAWLYYQQRPKTGSPT